MRDIHCFSFVEDEPSSAVLRKLVTVQNARREDIRIVFRPGFPKVLGGFGQLKVRTRSLLEMGRGNLFTLTDLDKGECAPTLIRDWFLLTPGQPIDLPTALWFRVAVREVEAWLMADREALARYLGISPTNIPRDPDDLGDPKQELLNAIRRKGCKNWHKDMLPRGSAHVGPQYNERICDFVNSAWVPARAAGNSPSLKRAIESLSRL